MNGNDDSPRDLLGAWALDAVDDLERAKVERAIASDEELAAEARQLRETIGRLAEADAQQPPEHVRDAVMAEIQNAAPTEETTSSAAVREDRNELARMRRRRRWQGLAAAAAAVVAVAIPTAVAVDQADRAEQAEVQAGFAQEQAQQFTDALLDPSAEVVSDDLPDGSRGIAVLGDNSALFAARDMTQLQDQDYQLWVLEGEEATSAGVLDWQEGELTASVEQFPTDAALAVTAEPIGGSEQPTTDPLMVLGSP